MRFEFVPPSPRARPTLSRVAAAIAGVLLFATAGAAAAPAVGIEGLRLEFRARAVSFALAPDRQASGAVAFAKGLATLGRDAGRSLADLRRSFRVRAGRDAAFAVLVEGGGEALAHQRARAIRTALIERLGEDPRTIVAAALPLSGKGEPTAALVRFVALDPAACAGCGATSVRTLAYDSDVARLVRALPADANGRPLEPAAVRNEDVARLGAAPSNEVVPIPPVAGPRDAAGGCVRPNVVIDDYWRGGPMVACDGTLRRPARLAGRIYR